MKLEKNDKFEINKKEEWKKMKGETKRKKKGTSLFIRTVKTPY